jgi:hypothetical protein
MMTAWTRPHNLRLLTLLCAALGLWLLAPRPALAIDLPNPDNYREAQDLMLLRINAERARAKAAPVHADPIAAQAAKEHADEMCSGGYLSHWDRAGLKPSRRLNLLGSYHALSENVYMGSGALGSTSEMVERAMDTLMASPGHRQTILGPQFTHVGLGLAISPDQRAFYVSQEFITWIGGEYSCELNARVGQSVEFDGRFDATRYSLEQLAVLWEERPEPRTPRALMGTGSYRDGEKQYAGYSPNTKVYFPGLDTRHEIQADQQAGWFKSQVLLDFKGREGMYYIMLWLKDKRSGEMVHAATATIDVTR